MLIIGSDFHTRYPSDSTRLILILICPLAPRTCEDCCIPVYTEGLPFAWSQPRDTKRECLQVQPCQTI